MNVFKFHLKIIIQFGFVITFISSLSITTSSSSEGVPVAQPKRALPAVPAFPASRQRSGSPARSRGSASERSSSTDTSSELRRLVLNQRLEAQFKLAQIEGVRHWP